MEVILLEKVNKLGTIGSVVKVKDGFARNFLIPRKKALRATKANLSYFEAQKAEIEKANLDKKSHAEANIAKFEGLSITIVRQAGEDGRLFGSVSANDIAKEIVNKTGFEVDAHSIVISTKLKEIGVYQIDVVLHPDIKASIELIISRKDSQ